MHLRALLLLSLLLLSPLEARKERRGKPPLASIQIIDRNGFSETLTGKDRLDQFERVNFRSPKPYQRVLRVYQPGRDGICHSFLTTYFDNGQLKQFLEIQNARAFGLYEEWYPQGAPKIRTHVIGGLPDITPAAQAQWVFDGPSFAYDEEGHLIAKIFYHKGLLEGSAETYSSEGTLLSRSPYSKGLLHGEVELFSPSGLLLEKHTYVRGLLEGNSESFWESGAIATRELYRGGKLLEGSSFGSDGSLLFSCSDGEGRRLRVSKGHLEERQEIHAGEILGEVVTYSEEGRVASIYHVKGGEKHGKESLFYRDGKRRMEIDWVEGKIQGQVLTWYPSELKESEREWIKNQKHGLSFAWYPNGELMLMESYAGDLLEKGDYFKKGEKSPTSKVIEGRGCATLFDKEGLLLRKITYEAGKPTS